MGFVCDNYGKTKLFLPVNGNDLEFYPGNSSPREYCVMREQKIYRSADGAVTLFDIVDSSVQLKMLCGSEARHIDIPRMQGLFAVAADGVDLGYDQWSLVQQSFEKNGLELIWEHRGRRLRIESNWRFCDDSGVWRRRDTICNLADESVTITKFLARFTLVPGLYELYSQASRWCCESQGRWQDISHGVVTLRSEGGRTTQGGTPYAALRSKDSGRGLVLHVIPRGDWVIKVGSPTAGFNTDPPAVLELGLSDQELHMRLASQESVQLPEILVQALPSEGLEGAAVRLHRYLLKHDFVGAKPAAPLVYNTWFDAFENLDIDRLRGQLQVAREIGCEVFTIDAGWYGQMEGNWAAQAGDWREKMKGAFKGRMRDFADEVRAAGLGFGLWMEPERNNGESPAVKAHPEHFLRGSRGDYYPDLSNQEAYNYILGEMSRLTEEYELAWMKIDFNFELQDDPYKRSFEGYYKAWFGLLDELRAKYPHTFFEACASGAMRLDISALKHCDGHFLSDSVYPWDLLRIYQGTVLRLLPGRLISWVVLRGIGCDHMIPYGVKLNEVPQMYLTAQDGTWQTGRTVDLDFAARVGLLSMFALSGDLVSLPAEGRDRLRHHAEFFKTWREFIAGSVAHLLTPVRPREDVRGWMAVQLQNPRKDDKNLVYVYRLEDGNDCQRVRLRGLQRDSKYCLRNDEGVNVGPQYVDGADLMDIGFDVTLPSRNSAAIFVLEPDG